MSIATTATDPVTDRNLHEAAGIVAAYVGNNSLRSADLPALIAAVHASLERIVRVTPAIAAPAVAAAPAVPIKKSIAHDYVVCLEDGKRFKSLRRHLASHHGLTPETYRAKWGLATDHPIVAPAYSAARSHLAKAAGLGVGVRKPGPVVAPAAKRGRPKKSG